MLLEQRGVREVFEMADAASLKFVGIGTVDPEAQLVSSGMIEPGEIEEIAAAGGVGELLGHFFDAEGRVLTTTLTRADAGCGARRAGDQPDRRHRRRAG